MGRREDVDNAIWADPDFLALTADARFLYLWSFTTPHCNMSGLYRVDERTMSFQTGLSPSRVERAFGELVEGGLLAYERPVLWVRARVKHLRSKSPSMARSIAGDVAALAPEHPLRRRFLEKYTGFQWLKEPLAEVAKDSRSTKPKQDTLSGGSGEPLQRFQGRATAGQGKGRTTATPQGEVDRQILASLSTGLRPFADPVRAVLLTVATAKAGAGEPTLAAAAKALADHPRKDFLPLARDFEHYWLHGAGGSRPLKDVVRAYRNWIGREPDVLRKTPLDGRARTQPDDTDRRLREAEL